MTQTTTEIGYGLLSSLISSDADLNCFRSFKALNVRNILYLQSELAEIEETLHDLDEECNDKAKGNDVWSIPRSWRAVKKEEGDYFEAVCRLRKTSKEYYRALQAHAWLLNLKRPAPRARKNLRGFFDAHRAEMSQMDASYITDEAHHADLIALYWEDKEAMSELLEKYFYAAFEKKGRTISTHGGELKIISNHRIRFVVRLLAILLSSVLPILSIVVLYNVHNQNTRLGLIVLFSALCSAALATLSDAKNVEIIAATAAFAAVQVVFVSGNDRM